MRIEPIYLLENVLFDQVINIRQDKKNKIQNSLHGAGSAGSSFPLVELAWLTKNNARYIKNFTN